MGLSRGAKGKNIKSREKRPFMSDEAALRAMKRPRLARSGSITRFWPAFPLPRAEIKSRETRRKGALAPMAYLAYVEVRARPTTKYHTVLARAFAFLSIKSHGKYARKNSVLTARNITNIRRA